ncbi:hypothetical protein CA265_01770 [Sphingobacteriaceae bacterium GW460-11-11-14-LB5]|nr:hypothetical protein CA265_01770 [Sphingobacteriaceae bacterium GW460-11-11-14-LB5]
MIEEVKYLDQTLAIIIRAAYKKEGIAFFTPGDFSQQLGYMNRQKGYVIEPHVHNLVERKVTLTQEVLYIKSGKVRVDFYDEDKQYLESRIVETGDVILLAAGGHGFEMLEDAEMIEIKQGPYCGDEDKVRFDHKPVPIKLIDKNDNSEF